MPVGRFHMAEAGTRAVLPRLTRHNPRDFREITGAGYG
jgi:hypothetical protein